MVGLLCKNTCDRRNAIPMQYSPRKRMVPMVKEEVGACTEAMNATKTC